MQSNKSKKKDELLEREFQRKRQLIIAQHEQSKRRLWPLVKFLKSSGLVFRHATVMNSRIEYFRVDQYEKLLKEQQKNIEKNLVITNILKQTDPFLIYFKRPESSKNIKYPSILQPTPQKNKFASFRFDTTSSSKVKIIIMLCLVFFLVLFPIWPFWLKYAIWLIAFYLLIFLVGLIVLRLIIFIICSIFGISMWIFPNLLSENGVFQSFKPFYIVEKWDNSIFNIALRLLSITIIAYFGYQIYTDPTYLQSYFESTKSTVSDIHDWGVNKITGDHKNFSQRAITNLQTILNETADVQGYNIPKEQLIQGLNEDKETPSVQIEQELQIIQETVNVNEEQLG